MKRKPFEITYSKRSKFWTVWNRLSGTPWPMITCAKTLQEAWKKAESHPLYGHYFKQSLIQ